MRYVGTGLQKGAIVDLFEYQAKKKTAGHRPLAERMRPRTLAQFVGQRHVVAEDKLIGRAIAGDRIFSMILWGPPGCGKTTLARLIARETRAHFLHFSAVLSGVKEIRAVIAEAKKQVQVRGRKTILFVDEIHRFNKAQQDAFLHHVESGLITLIGATTENPSFEVIAALLSRCRVITLNPLTTGDIKAIITRALTDSEKGIGASGLVLEPQALDSLAQMADGDGRAALNNLEVVAAYQGAHAGTPKDSPPVTVAQLQNILNRKALLYDKAGDEHFNLISALHKSLRGSDPDAALYWLARMLTAGEDPLYVARRMVRFASEDIGNADPNALTVALNGVEAYRFLGSPEGELALAQVAVYLATAPKSNRVYAAYHAVQDEIKSSGSLPVPLHIRNAPTKLMRSLDYGKNYRYAHDYDQGYVRQDYLPEALQKRKFYRPTDRGFEKNIQKRLAYWAHLRAQTGPEKV